MKINNYIYPVVLILFILNPLLGILTLINLFFFFKIKDEKYYNLLLILLSIWISLINLTKIPESDLYNHGWRYLQVENFDLIPYLILNGKEPIYFIFNFLVFHLSNGSVKFWVFAFTFISYYLFLKAVYLFFKEISGLNNRLILGLAIAALFPQLFSLSAHLIRQFMASSFFIYFAVNKIFYNKNKWWLVIAGILTHSSSVLLFPLVYLNFLGDFKNKKIYNISLLIILASYQFFSSLFLKILNGKLPMLVYILERASGDTTYDLGEFPRINFLVILIMLIISISYIVNYSKSIFVLKNDTGKKYEEQTMEFLLPRITHFFGIIWVLSIFILFNTNQSELSIRMFFYLFFFFPMLIPLSFKKHNFNIKGYVFILFFLFYFFYRLSFGTWEYATIFDIMTNSLWSYIMVPEPVIY